MELKFCHAVTTFKKNTALRVWVETFFKFHDAELLGHLVISDDNYPEAQEVYDEFKDQFEGKLIYIGGERAGIAKQKNRCIRYFMEETEDNCLICYDDDIQFVGAGLERQILKAKYAHITGYLGDPRFPNQWDIILPFFQDFKPMGETEYLWFCPGSQGVMMFMTREVINQVGYFDTEWKGRYGFEHSIYSNRINKIHGFYPDWFPVLKGCERFFITQEVPNNYIPDYITDKKGDLIIDEKGRPKLVNEAQWIKRRQEVYDGWSLYKKNHGL